MRWGVSILYVGLHASCSILRIFFLLFIVGEGWRGAFLWKKVGGIGERGYFCFHQKFQKTNFSQQNNGRYDQIHFFETKMLAVSNFFMLYPEPDINPIKCWKSWFYVCFSFLFKIVVIFFLFSKFPK